MRSVLLPGRYTLGAAGGDLDLTESGRSVVLQGSGAGSTILDAAGVDRLLEVNSGVTVTLRDLTLTGGRTTGDGGAIFAQSSRVVLDNVIVEGNQSQAGGGLAASNSKLTMIDSRVRLNTAVGSTDHEAQGGGVFGSNSQTVIVQSDLTQNSVRGTVGAKGNNGENAQDPWTDGTSGGTGGAGGAASGGGIAQANGVLSFHRVSVRDKAVAAGSGGVGGNGGNGDWVNALDTGRGGQGGQGGQAFGGGVFVQGGFFAANESEISQNRALASGSRSTNRG